VELYDVATDTWTAVTAELEARYQRGAVTVCFVGSAEEQDLFDALMDKAPRHYITRM
jgi:hypothetical protein